MIYLVRHGETEFNAERRQQGHMDSPLTALGRAQAQAAGELLKRQIADAEGWRIVASPLGRGLDDLRVAELFAGPAASPGEASTKVSTRRRTRVAAKKRPTKTTKGPAKSNKVPLDNLLEAVFATLRSAKKPLSSTQVAAKVKVHRTTVRDLLHHLLVSGGGGGLDVAIKHIVMLTVGVVVVGFAQLRFNSFLAHGVPFRAASMAARWVLYMLRRSL